MAARRANGSATSPHYKHNQPEELQLLTFNGTAGNNGVHTTSNGIYDREFEVTTPDATTNLGPGWDGLNYPEEVLNFKTTETVHPPRDRYRLVFFIMMINGCAILMPWNMFITAKAYFEDHKLNVNGTVSEYRDFFMNYLGIMSQFPNALMALMNVICHCGLSRGNLQRMVWSTVIITIMFVITVVLAVIDSSTWPAEFFWVTMVTVVIINAANGVFQSCVYGISAKLPMKYTNSVILGSNLSGTVVALVGIISIAASPNLRIAAIYYFISAIVILVITFDCYFILPLSRFYRHYNEQSMIRETIDNKTDKNDGPPFRAVFKKIWVQMLNIWFIFFITLAVFPAIQAAVKPLDPNFPIHPDYWAPIFCFLSFNVFAVLGNITSTFLKFPSHRFLWIPVVLRGLFFIPFFMLCNYRPDVRDLTLFPVVINNDWVFIAGAAVTAFLSGYLSSLCMMYAPKLVAPHMAGTAGMMMACALCVGVFTGTLFSLALAKIFVEFGSLPLAL